MHIATAIRYAYDALLTNERKVYLAGERLAREHSSTRILSPAPALRWILGEITLHRKR